MLQVAHKPCLVHRIDRPQSHGYRGEAPEIFHQPGVRIRRQPRLVPQLMAEILHPLLADASLKKRAPVNAGRSVPLKINQVTRLVAIAGVEEMIKAYFKQTGYR